MKAVVIIDVTDDLNIPLEDIKIDITVSARDAKKTKLYFYRKYTERSLRPLPREWTMDEVEPCAYNEGFVDGLNHCIYLITGEIK